MSSILKALKKLEHDNASCKPGQLKIDAKILQERSNTGISRPTALVLFIVFVAIGSGSTYFLMKQQTKTPTPTNLNSNTSQSDQKPIQQEIAPMPKPVTIVTAPTPQHVPSLTARSITKSEPGQTTTQSFPPPAAASSGATEKPTAPEQSPATPSPAAQQPAPTNQGPTSITRPILTVNGIASQDGNSENFAVINGTTVSKGSVIEGVKVEDIRSDRVRFSHNGENFEIILNKSNR